MAIDTLMVYVGVYGNVDDAEADYQLVKDLHTEADLIDAYDAAVDRAREGGKTKIVKKHETPTRVGGVLGGGVGLATGLVVALFPFAAIGGGLLAGTAAGGAILGAVAGHAAAGMSRHDLKELGEHLDAGQAGLVVVAVSDMGAKVEQAMKRAEKIEQKEIEADWPSSSATPLRPGRRSTSDPGPRAHGGAMSGRQADTSPARDAPPRLRIRSRSGAGTRGSGSAASWRFSPSRCWCGRSRPRRIATTRRMSSPAHSSSSTPPIRSSTRRSRTSSNSSSPPRRRRTRTTPRWRRGRCRRVGGSQVGVRRPDGAARSHGAGPRGTEQDLEDANATAKQAEQDAAAAEKKAAEAGNETDKAKAEADKAKADAKVAESKAAVVADCAKAYFGVFGALFEGDDLEAQAAKVRKQLESITDECQAALGSS